MVLSSNLSAPSMTTKQLGNIEEAKALAKLVSMNIPIYVGFGDNENIYLMKLYRNNILWKRIYIKLLILMELSKYVI